MGASWQEPAAALEGLRVPVGGELPDPPKTGTLVEGRHCRGPSLRTAREKGRGN